MVFFFLQICDINKLGIILKKNLKISWIYTWFFFFFPQNIPNSFVKKSSKICRKQITN
jgi:hypothetical protein